MRSLLSLAMALALSLVGAPSYADSLFTDEGGLLSDRLGDRRSSFGPGALVTVLVTENLQASTGATTKANKQARTGASWDFGTILPRVAKSQINLEGRSEFNGEGVTRRQGQITMEVAAVIKEIMPDGSLRIEGTKELKINDEVNTIMLSGLVRPFDIDAANRVQSTRIGDFKLDYKGSGSATAKATPGLLSRLLNWLF